MNIIYLSSVCAQSSFERMVLDGKITAQFQNQKFHHLLLTGLKHISDDSIEVVSYYPINRKSEKTRHYREEMEGGIRYIYPGHINVPILHHLSKFIGTFHQLRRLYNKDSIVVCNIMNFDECRAALAFRRFHGVKICAVTADVPGITSGAGRAKGAFWKRLLEDVAAPFYHSANNRYDGYLFLTNAMNAIVNTKSKPYVVVEGLADSGMASIDNTITCKYHNKTILYAGGLHKEYGIQLLVDAFRRINNPSVELHIYGRGNYESTLINVTQSDSRIKYFGTRNNKEIVIEQTKAHILVNPRPSNEDFVKYSFPSKIIECMASGTPLLTTCLPGIPLDYYPYIYTIEDETVDGVYHALSELLSKSIEELHEKGLAAKEFIIAKKNPDVQASKLLTLINTVISDK